ncbi:Calx-beta domain-containing protein, partial [Planctomycetota bacterium]
MKTFATIPHKDLIRKTTTRKASRLTAERLEDRALLSADFCQAIEVVPEFRGLPDHPDVQGLQVAHQTATEGEDLVFRLSLPDNHQGGVSVTYELEHDTTDKGDFIAKAGKVRIEAGETEQFVRVPTTADNDAEPTETFRIRLTNVIGAEVSEPVAYGTIRDDDTEPTIYVNSVSTTVGEDAEFVLNLSNPYKGGLSLDWTTQEGTAKSGEHFETRGGKLEFAP